MPDLRRHAQRLALAVSLAAALSGPSACRPVSEFGDPVSVAPGCGEAATPISAVQGSGFASPLSGQEVTVEAIVTAVFQGRGLLGGFFIQEEDADRDDDPETSEALFVATSDPVNAGDRVRLTGTVVEDDGRTGLVARMPLAVCDTGRPLPSAEPLELPNASRRAPERFENMRIEVTGATVINDVYNLWRHGEFTVASARRFAPTQAAEPGAPAQALATRNALDELVIGDGVTVQNARVVHAGEDEARPFAADNPVRAGQTITGLAGVLHETAAGWRLIPTRPYVIDAATNPRTPGPAEVGGSLRVAAFNVLNYFTTLKEQGPACGPERNRDCRGADTPAELARQTGKTVAALLGLDADLIGLVELENDGSTTLATLLAATNAAAGQGTYAMIHTGVIGSDVITPGLIYRPSKLAPVGPHALLTRAVDARFHERYNRPALAQTFCDRSSGTLFTVSVNHLKSKGSSCDAIGDPDAGDGQGNCNRTRLRAASALADWMNGDPTGTGAAHALILGDLNANAREDPIRALEAAGFVNLAAAFEPDATWSFNFFGQAGEIDYAFGNPVLTGQVTGATIWHINADEAPALDYNQEFGKPADYYRPDPFRSSDHDPVLVGLEFSPPEPHGTPAACP